MSGSVTGNIYCMSSRYVYIISVLCKYPMTDKGKQYSDPASQCLRQSFLHQKGKPLQKWFCVHKNSWSKSSGCGGLVLKKDVGRILDNNSSSQLFSLAFILPSATLYMYIQAMFTEKYFSLELDWLVNSYSEWHSTLIIPQERSHPCTLIWLR